MKRNPELKIKLKSLAAEARIIRQDETKAYKLGDYSTGNSLHNHRTQVVRPEARATLLAYQYLRGVPYAACEQSPKTDPKWHRVNGMVKKYGGNSFDYEKWEKGKPQKAGFVDFVTRLIA